MNETTFIKTMILKFRRYDISLLDSVYLQGGGVRIRRSCFSNKKDASIKIVIQRFRVIGND